MSLTLNLAVLGYCIYGLLHGFNISWKAASYLATAVFVCSKFLPYLLKVWGDKLMDMFVHHWRVYVYNVSWEDPRVDTDIMKPDSKDHVLTICSAGCNAFDYLISGCKVTAVDMNECQLALAEVRAKAVEKLPWAEVFDIFAKNNMEKFVERYENTLKNELSEASRSFWDSKIVGPAGAKRCKIKTFMYSGTSGWTAYVTFRIFFPLVGLGWLRKAMMDGVPLEEIRERYNKSKRGFYLVGRLAESMMGLGFASFIGVPARQFALGSHRKNFPTVLDQVFLNTDLVNDNYFLYGYICGEYSEINCPRWLAKDNFLTLRKAFVTGQLRLVHASLAEHLLNETAKPKESDKEVYTIASLLDHMDWMPARIVDEEMAALLPRMSKSSARIWWRSFGDTDYAHSPPLRWLKPTMVADCKQDRVAMYWSTWLADLSNSSVGYCDRHDWWTVPQNTLNLGTWLGIITFPCWRKCAERKIEGTAHRKKIEAFYSYQKAAYDATREQLLVARPLLMDAVPLGRDPIVWVDVGGGTARNLEFFDKAAMRQRFKKIYVVDISKSLLETAAERVKAAGLEDLVEIIEHDVTEASVFDVLPATGSVDLVTFSYSLSMIPDKLTALGMAMSLLKPDGKGHLGIGDFYSPPTPCTSGLTGPLLALEQLCHRAWFRQDGIYFLQDQLLKTGMMKSLTLEWEERLRGPVPFMPFFRPYHSVFVWSTASKQA